MSCRLPIACLLLSLSACKQVADVGGEAVAAPACVTRCMDAGTGAGSGGTLDGGFERPEASVPSADEATYETFTDRLNGLWAGASAAINSEEGTLGSRFEITLDIAPGGVVGTFVVRCLEQPACDPFGPGSAREEGGALEMSDLVTAPYLAASGKLRWINRFGRESEAPFWDMRRAERPSGAALTFDVGFPGAASKSVAAYRVVLAEGSWPDASALEDLDAAASEASLPDGGAPDAGVVSTQHSDAGPAAVGDP